VAAHLLDQLAVIGPPLLIIWPFLQLSEEWFWIPPLLLLFALIGLQYLLLALRGQTLGKRALRIKIVRRDGSPASFVHTVILRSLVPQMISVVVGVFSVVDYCFVLEKERRCLHDRIADTIVVKV
jgi:uncharacterized RDD family membrane protein YckC